jgi:hypothetical protein
MRYDIACDRDQGRPSVSAGLRESIAQKLNCPRKSVINALKDNDWQWTFRIRHGEHNPDTSSIRPLIQYIEESWQLSNRALQFSPSAQHSARGRLQQSVVSQYPNLQFCEIVANRIRYARSVSETL